MSSYDAFAITYKELFEELQKVVPEESAITKHMDEIKDVEPKELMSKFLNQIKDSNAIVSRKDSYFRKPVEGSFVKLYNLDKYYNEFSDNTKDVLWQYLNSLFVLSTTINNMPPEIMNAIEGIAQKCANDMEGDGKHQMPDMANLFAGMQNMLGGMMKK